MKYLTDEELQRLDVLYSNHMFTAENTHAQEIMQKKLEEVRKEKERRANPPVKKWSIFG
jgi:hypothetical protein